LSQHTVQHASVSLIFFGKRRVKLDGQRRKENVTGSKEFGGRGGRTIHLCCLISPSIHLLCFLLLQPQPQCKKGSFASARYVPTATGYSTKSSPFGALRTSHCDVLSLPHMPLCCSCYGIHSTTHLALRSRSSDSYTGPVRCLIARL
jgi:hypothetical protein